jgi:tRNA-specific 2-thiouridylase
MSVEALADHLERPSGRGHTPRHACTGAAGGAACGDLVRVSLAVDPESPHGLIGDAGFDASGCGAALAAGSAVVALVRGRPLLEAARVGAEEIALELGGLSAAKRHAAELAADALHRALGWAARSQARLAPAAERVVVAMSGGVDSAVAALLVAEDGAEAVAVTLELWSDSENDASRSCCSAEAVRHARQVAHGLGLPHLSIDLREEFRAGVVEPWLAGHAAGLTPNPCVRCNGSVRLDAMLELAERLGARTLATGHYARVSDEPDRLGPDEAGRPGVGETDGLGLDEADGTGLHGRDLERRGFPLLRMAVDEGKDQSYALAALSPQSLARLRFPLGGLTKAQVRGRAAQAGLAVARRPDSQDLCFLAGTGRSAFLARHGGIGARPGPIVDVHGRTLGRHEGVHTVTVGQRRGLGISGGDPVFVLETDVHTNTVTAGPRESLRTDTVSVGEVTLHSGGARVDSVKVRYRGRRMPCRLEGSPRAGVHARLEIRLLEPIERTAPGQIACLYAGDLIVGHGTIA